MYKLNRWWWKQLNRVHTCLHTLSWFLLYFIFCTTQLFSNVFSWLQFSIMFFVKFWKKSFLEIRITTILFSVLEFCYGHPVPTLYTWNAVYMCFICQTRHVLVLHFAFVIVVIRNADSLQMIQLFLNQMGRVGFCNCILS